MAVSAQACEELYWNATDVEGAVDEKGFWGVETEPEPASLLGLDASKRFLEVEI